MRPPSRGPAAGLLPFLCCPAGRLRDPGVRRSFQAACRLLPDRACQLFWAPESGWARVQIPALLSGGCMITAGTLLTSLSLCLLLGKTTEHAKDLSAEKKWLTTVCHGLGPRWLSGEEPACQCRSRRDVGSIPGWGRSPGGGIATYCSLPAWWTPRAEEPAGLRPTGPRSWPSLRGFTSGAAPGPAPPPLPGGLPRVNVPPPRGKHLPQTRSPSPLSLPPAAACVAPGGIWTCDS